MKNNSSKYLKYSALIFVISTLFLINPFFKDRYDEAERNVQAFKKFHKPEYDSLVRKYDILYELIVFMDDSAENVINQKIVLLNHSVKMKKLTSLITEDEYQRKVIEAWDLELTEHSTRQDSFVQRLIRLDYPEEKKLPQNLSKEVTLYQGIDGFIRLMKWVILVLSAIAFVIEYFKKKNLNENKIPTINKSEQLQVPTKRRLIYEGKTLQRIADGSADLLQDGEFLLDESGKAPEVPIEVIQVWEKETEKQLAANNQMEYRGMVYKRLEDDIWVDEEYNIVDLPQNVVQRWEKTYRYDIKEVTTKADQSYSEMSKYNVLEDEHGNKIITELTTIEQANALKAEVEKFMEGNATVLAKLIPREDKAIPQMYQLTIVFKDI